MVTEVEAEVEALLGEDGAALLDLEALETAARRCALSVAAQALQEKLNADGSDYQGPWLGCECGGRARYAGRRRKRFTSALGGLVLERAYYHCEACESGFYPRDRELGLEGGSLSPGALRMVGTAAARVSFAESSELLAELAGLRIDPKRVERAAEALGGEIAADERLRVESDPPSAPTMYLGMDGTGVPVRRGEMKGRAGKQPDGSAKTREVKLVTLWTAQSLDRHGRASRDSGSVSYSAAIESAAGRDTDPGLSAFARRVGREAERRGFELAPRPVVLGDGAPWIWNLTGEQFPEAIEIVDLYHAQEKIWDASRALHGTDLQRLREWAEAGCEALVEGRLDDLLSTLQLGAAQCEPVRHCAEYVQRNRHRMQYADFRAQGLMVGSGVIEAGCKTTIGARLKRAGMHWSVKGANAIIALRCCYLSGRFEDFWEHRSIRGSSAISKI